MNFNSSLDFARSLDEQDPLKEFRNSFIIPKNADGSYKTYFLGNSLGLQPHSCKASLEKILDQWASLGVEGFFEGDEPWMILHDRLAAMMAPVAGAKPSEITIMNQLTVNLHLMMVSFYQLKGRRKKILVEKKAFPSDQYMLESMLRFLGEDPSDILIEIPSDPSTQLMEMNSIIEMIRKNADELAMVFLGGLNYYTGQVLDMEAITSEAHKAGAKAGFDLAHAAGNVPLQLHDWNVDFACWCNYKYLNGGPGAVGTAFIHERYHEDKSINRLGGWWGHNKSKRFLMEQGFEPVQSAEGWQLSTPPILLYAALEASLKIFDQAGMPMLFEKSKLLSNYMLWLLEDLDKHTGGAIKLITPASPGERGSQFSLLILDRGKEVYDFLKEKGFFCDWREPNVIRIAPVPLYNTYEEAWNFYRTLSLFYDQGTNH